MTFFTFGWFFSSSRGSFPNVSYDLSLHPNVIRYSIILSFLTKLMFFNLFTIRSLKERQSQSTTNIILGKPHGGENPAKLLYYRFINQVQCQEETCAILRQTCARSHTNQQTLIRLSLSQVRSNPRIMHKT